MLDPKLIRENPELVRQGIAKKRLAVDLDGVIAADAEHRALLRRYEEEQSQSKKFNGDFVAAKKSNSPEALAAVKKAIEEFQKSRLDVEQLKQAEGRVHEAMLSLPNLPHSSVPEGGGPADNVVVAEHGDAKAERPHAIPHWEIPGFDRIIDFARGSKVTGAGFPFYVGDGARIVRALIRLFLEENAKAGYEEVQPPIMVNAASATATGNLPDKEGQMYETTADHLYAVPTAEVPLTNFFRDEILEESLLPLNRCAYTPCFRREAGSYGKDVRGLNRLHQFDKVELLKWVAPSASYDELEKLRADAERLLQLLELPYRVLSMCGGDLGFAPAKKYDLDVWSAGQKRWLEVSSCSNFEAFQSRRAQIRFRPKATGKPELVHTLNGSGLAVPRVLAALLENNLQADGTVRLPAALASRFGGDRLKFS